MRPKQVILSFLKISAFAIGLLSSKSQAQKTSLALAPYTVEFSPVLGILLPYDIWGTPGTMNTVGIRSSYVLSPPDGAIEIGALYHSAGVDRAFVIDASWRQEIALDFLLSYFSIGYHYSKWDLDIDYDAAGLCVPTSCQTDSGFHSGIKVGAGVQIPLGPTTPLKLGMIFYSGPQLILLLEAGLGIRF
jgi:hypothetical protein